MRDIDHAQLELLRLSQEYIKTNPCMSWNEYAKVFCGFATLPSKSIVTGNFARGFAERLGKHFGVLSPKKKLENSIRATREFSRNYPSNVDFLKNKANSISDFYQFAKNRYGSEGVEILRKLESINPTYSGLIADPGIALRIEQFESFVTNSRRTYGNLWDARQAFSNSLGSSKVYRAVAISDEEARLIAFHGHLAGKFRNVENLRRKEIGDDINYHIGEHVDGSSPISSLVSVTNNPDVATAVAFGLRGKDIKKRIVLYEIDMPRIETVPVPLEHQAQIAFIINVHPARGQPVKVSMADEKLESLVYLRISPEHITSSRVVSSDQIGRVEMQSKFTGEIVHCLGNNCP